jgi:hypothetical protein
MRSSLVATKGLKLVRSRSVREDAARRRWAVAGAVAGLALAGGLAGYLAAPSGPAELRTGPFSYFPSQ